MRRKLWPNVPAKEGAWDQMSKNFQVYFIYINFFKIPKKNYNRAKELYCDTTIFVFWFFTVYLTKKNGNWKIAQGCHLSRTTLIFVSYRCRWHLYIMLKESYSTNHIIFLYYSWPAGKLSFLKTLICNIQKIFCVVDFLVLGLKLVQIFTNTLFGNWPTTFWNFHAVLKLHQNIGDKNEKKFFSTLIWKKYF